MPKSKRRKRSKSKTGFFGVTKNPRGGKYVTRITIGNKTKHLGSYNTAKQAAKAYDKEVIRLRCKPLSKLNYPNKAPVGYTPKQKTLMSTNTVGYRDTKVGRSSKQRSILQVKTQDLVITIHQKKLPLPTTVLYSNPTNPHHY